MPENSEIENSEISAESPAEAKPSPQSNMLFVIIIGLLVMVLTPLASYVVVRLSLPASPIEDNKIDESSEEQVVLDMEPVIVNIAQTKGTRILKLVPHLVLSEAALRDELQNSSSLLADRILLACSRKTIDDLEGPEGRSTLKRDIMVEVNAAIQGRMKGSVVDIYLSEFLIQ
jgi:flagellar basal body-associated protein FliL